MIGKIGRVANVFRQGFSSVGDDAARSAFASQKAESVAHAAAQNHDDYLSRLPELTRQFAGNAAAPSYTGMKGAVYGVGRAGGKVGHAAGETVKAMGGPVGVAMTAPMALMMLPPSQPQAQVGEESETEEMRYARMLQQQAIDRQQGGTYY